MNKIYKAMNKFKYGEEVYIISSKEKVKIKSVISNFSKKISNYVLEDGRILSECFLTKKLKEEPKKRGRNKKEVIEESPILLDKEQQENND